MSFLRHTSCPVCPSSDGFAEYAGGSGWCFVCHHYRPPTGSPYVGMARALVDSDANRMRDLPYDAGFEYSPEAVSWCESFGVGIPELIDHNVLWSVSKKQLIFPFYAEDDKPLASAQGGVDGFAKPILWQARNFRKGNAIQPVQKYVTHGEKESVIPIFRHQLAVGNAISGIQPVVIVEDCISAIKVARLGGVAVPCLGSTIGRDKLARLRAVLGASRPYAIWLDSNMYDKAQQISQRLALLGCASRVVWSADDPKCYTEDQIASMLRDCGVESNL